MTWSQEISQLITGVDQLTSAANVKKSALDASVASTEADKDAAAASANTATVSAATSLTRAQESETHKNTALAVYGTTAAQQTAVASVQASSALASGYAASGSAALQQDLSGIATALHRSPNAVTSMFIYDTSKDSDGGAWTEKCQNTSWYNEPIMGKWLGPHTSESNARYEGATLGISFGDIFSSVTGYTVSSGASPIVSSGWLQFNPGGSGAWASKDYTTVVGRRYRVTGTFRRTATNATVFAGTGSGGGTLGSIVLSNSGTFVLYFTATTTTSNVGVQTANGTIIEFQLGNLVEVLSVNTTSGDYFQLTTDGKFYRLWKNLLSWTEDFRTTAQAGDTRPWGHTAVTPLATSEPAPTGPATVWKIVPTTGTASQHVINTASVFSAGTYTQTVYAKAAGYDHLIMGSNQFGNLYAWFNLATGVPGTRQSGISSSSMTLVGNGWYRCQITSEYGGNATYRSFAVGNADNVFSFSGDGTSGIYLWGAQNEFGSTATTYEPKTTISTTSEVFRGNKRDFPRLAAIVSEASSVNIYDLTEPGRPMWMRFISSGTNSLITRAIMGNNNINAMSAMNGILVIGNSTNSGYHGSAIEFILDGAKHILNGSGTFVFNGNLSNRNTASTALSGNGYFVGSTSINAIAMTILPDAPTDPVTGLRVPTIAIATGGGASVIRNNGTVVNLTPVGGALGDLGFLADGRLFISPISGVSAWYAFLISKDLATANRYSFYGYDGTTEPVLTNAFGAEQVTAAAISASTFLTGTASGTMAISKPNSIRARGLVTRIKSNYNTGWLTGDARRVYLSDTDTGAVAGPELVANGTFDTDLTGWSDNISATWDAGGVLLTATSASAQLAQSFTTVVGRTYLLGYQFVSGNLGNSVLRIGTAANSASILNLAMTAGIGSFSRTFVATSTTTWVTLFVAYPAVSINGKWDNISVREAVVDRSYKAQGASTTGTLTKTQLASGTSLVGYSGWSATNYLREPYSADLDFGTGEWSASAWVNIPSSALTSNYPTYGSDLLSGAGAFTSSTGWEGLTASCTVSGGSLTKTGTATHYIRYPLPALSLGDVVLVKFDVTEIFASVGVRIGHAPGWNASSVNTIGTHYRIFTAFNIQAGNFIGFDFNGGTTGTIQNLTVYKVKPFTIFSRRHSSGAYLELVSPGANYVQAIVSDGTTVRTVTAPAFTGQNDNPILAKDVWQKVEANYTTDGSLAIRVNGREVSTTRGNPLLTLNNTSATLTIGNNNTADASFPGSIALLKLGATVPTAEQSTFMYEQEKQLFRANATSVLPDAGSIVDMSYDDTTDRWVSISTANESYWNGLVRTSVTPVPAGSYSKIATTSGVELAARITTNPGVDVTIPAYVLREELVKRSEPATKLNRQIAVYDYIGGFTGNITTGSTAIASVTNLTYPVSLIGARISGTGIPANATITAVSGTTIYISAAATATTTALTISFLDFNLPVGFETENVTSAGVVKQEGATKDYIRLFDGFIETIRFAVAPGVTTWVRIQATKSIQ